MDLLDGLFWLSLPLAAASAGWFLYFLERQVQKMFWQAGPKPALPWSLD